MNKCFNFRLIRLLGKIGFTIFIFSLFFYCPEEMFAEEKMEYSDIQLIMHHGRPHGGHHGRHSMHHGMGRRSQGICPQTRTTAHAPSEIGSLKNPLELTRENLDRGESLFQRTAEPTACKICHGPEGNGFGMMAQGLSPMPRNFTCKETMNEIADGQMFWIIKNGSPGTGMPAFKLFLSDEEIWQLILYIRQFSKSN